jgi:putative ATP-binding cassette transporter
MTWSDKLARLHQFLRQVWHLASPYFRGSDERWKARGLLAAIIALNLGMVYVMVLVNDWQRHFFDAMQNLDQATFWREAVFFTLIATVFILVAIYRFYLTELLQLRWRAWMTRELMGRWLSGNAFYRMELGRYAGAAHEETTPTGLPEQGQRVPDNPDQRLEEDVHIFTMRSVDLSMGLLNAVVTLLSFITILWKLSGDFSFSLGGSEIAIPGFMVWAVLLYCLVGSVFTHYIGRPLIGLNFEQQRREGDFRHHLVRVREYSEAIALDQAGGTERRNLDGRFSSVLANYLALIKKRTKLLGFTELFGQTAVLFPFMLAAPRLFSGAIKLGEVMQISGAFGYVQNSLSWFVNNYDNLAAWRATTERLTSFEAGLALLDATPSRIERVPATPDATTIEADGLSLQLPTGITLLQDATLRAAPGEHTLIQGPSGSGKSTLLRALTGIWPWARGRVKLPEGMMVIPQRPYFPDGALRDALAYPDDAGAYTDEQLRQALHDALLPRLAERLDERDNWTQKLSGGEQQRLAIARVLLKQPAWVLADEATAALDLSAEHSLYQRLRALTERRGGALVSIAHRPSVAEFHRYRWQLVPQAEDAPARFRIDRLTMV